ncbi:hypothetical protein, partial [Desulfobacula sp.]|uniref:hypothetical protein n=2 Tax=Desulfobacula sp. TaxID=2593537 RepID=UPI0039B86850|nr:hypothetical protein [Desulfobacula sp.]
QAASGKRQAASGKRQAASGKRQAARLYSKRFSSVSNALNNILAVLSDSFIFNIILLIFVTLFIFVRIPANLLFYNIFSFSNPDQAVLSFIE